MIIFVTFALIIGLNTLILYLFVFFYNTHSFFKTKHFPTLKPKFIVGNFGDILWMKKPLGLCFSDLYKQSEPHKYVGLFALHKPLVLIRDPELIKNIFIKDFDSFRTRTIEFKKGDGLLHRNLLRMTGDEWKNTRAELSPFFKLAKMKIMMQSVQQCANRFGRILDQTNGEAFDMKTVSEQFSIDVIGSCAFGVNFCAMKDPNCIVRQMAKKIFQFRFQTIFRHVINPPKFLTKMFNLSYMDDEVETFFLETMRKALNMRKRSLNPRDDIITLLLANKHKTVPKNTILDSNQTHNGNCDTDDPESTMEFNIAQCYVFFTAGFETTSTALTYAMMELALHQSIQNKVRDEIIAVLGKHNGQLTYDCVKEMTYTDMVIEETLRLHAPITILSRKCTKAYQIPDTGVIIPQEMGVMVSVHGLHTDSKYYEKPNEFYPEHFTKEAKSNRPSCAYIPFGEGPRRCIAMRFAEMEIKVAIVNIIRDYVLEISPKMKFPLEYGHDMKLGLLAPRDGVWLQCRKYQT